MEPDNMFQNSYSSQHAEGFESASSVSVDFQTQYHQALSRELPSGMGLEVDSEDVRQQLRYELLQGVKDELRMELYHEVRRGLEEEIRQQLQGGTQQGTDQSPMSASQQKTEGPQMGVFQTLKPKELKEQWEIKMYSETREAGLTGPDGNFISSKELYCCSPRYIHYALEIIRRYDPTNSVIVECYAPLTRDGPTLELTLLGKTSGYDTPRDGDMTPCSTRYLTMLSLLYSTIPKPALDLDIFAVAHWQLQCSILAERLHTYRCIVAHPYYISLSPKRQEALKQEMITFFDRRFTSMIGKFLGVLLFQIGNQLLRLGDDEWIRAQDGLDTGTQYHRNEPSLFMKNLSVWKELVRTKAEF